MNHPNGISSVDAAHGGIGPQRVGRPLQSAVPVPGSAYSPMMQQPQQQQQMQQQAQPLQQMQQQQQHSTMRQPSNSSPQRLPSQRSGPRANCDQVVFEAIAKAAEIVVASRCWIESNPSSASQTGSGRFNLLVPEVKSVRNILQRWKRTMHVPLRLDVYYQHQPTANQEAGERELLERWCLEYAPTASNSSAGMYDEFNIGHVDPIVQLRKVCKNIVVWLRTLYCHSRLLPAQALRKNYNISNNNNNGLNSIGFSIYVVGEGQDDVSGLVQSGFDTEPKPSNGGSYGVPTPYGVLGWRVYLAPRELVRRLVGLEKERVRLLQQQYANTSPATTSRSIPMKVIPQQQQQHQQRHGYGTTPPAAAALPVARSAPTHNRGYRRANSDSLAAHTHTETFGGRQQQLQPPENPRYYSRSPGRNAGGQDPSAMLGPRSYHRQGDVRRRFSEDISQFNTNNSGLYPNGPNDTAPSSTPQNNDNDADDSPSSERSAVGGINNNKNLSALSLALLSMESSPTSPASTEASDGAAAGKADELAPSEIRRAALHNAPPSAATGVGEYGYGYNNHQHHNSKDVNTNHQPNIHPNLSTSPATNPSLFRGPSTPVSSTFGTTPPGYLLSATPSVGSHGTTSLGTTPGGLLLPPARSSTPGAGPASSAVAPPFVRPLGFAGQAQTTPQAAAPEASGQASEGSQQTPPPPLPQTVEGMDNHKPALDLLHSSPFQTSVVGGPNHPPQKDGLSCFLQAEETASMEAATTFINDFYHHHYPMASMASGVDDHHHQHMASAYEDYQLHHAHHASGVFAEGASSSAFLEHESSLLQAEDMPFAVEGLSSGVAPSQQSSTLGSLTKNNATMSTNEASLMVASMGMVPQKKLALFESSSIDRENSSDKDADVDALTDQLADFRSFGATLASPAHAAAPLTTSVGSGG